MKSSTPGFVQSSVRIFDLSLGDMLWSRRTIFMALVVGLPVLLALIVRVLFELGAPINRNLASGSTLFGLMIWVFFIRFAVPVLGVFYGTSLIADEVDDKTITYLFTRPIPRGAILIGKYLAYLACTVFVVLPAVMLVWLLIVPIGGSLAAGFVALVKDLALIALGLAVYGAVFAMLGARLKRPLLVGLLFVFGWETLVMAVPGTFKTLSIAYYLQGLVPHAMPSDSAVSLLQQIFQDSPSLTRCLTVLTIIEVVSLWLGARAIATKEYVLEQ